MNVPKVKLYFCLFSFESVYFEFLIFQHRNKILKTFFEMAPPQKSNKKLIFIL